MKILKWLDENFEKQLMAICLWGIVIIMGAQIIMRYGFKASIRWSEEISRYLFIWFTFLGMSYCFKLGAHMRIDILEVTFPKLKKPFMLIGDAAFLVTMIILIVKGIPVIQAIKASGQTSPAAEMPMYLVYMSVIVGAILTVIRVIQKYVLLTKDKGQESAEEAA